MNLLSESGSKLHALQTLARSCGAPVHTFAKRLECVLAVCKDLAVAFHLLAMIISAILLMISSVSAHAQGGVPLWTNRFSGYIALDKSGNVFVTGTDDLGNNEDYVTIKYSNAGIPLW